MKPEICSRNFSNSIKVIFSFSQEDFAELSETAAPEVDAAVGQETMNEQGEVSLDEVSESENQEADVASEDPEASNS